MNGWKSYTTKDGKKARWRLADQERVEFIIYNTDQANLKEHIPPGVQIDRGRSIQEPNVCDDPTGVFLYYLIPTLKPYVFE